MVDVILKVIIALFLLFLLFSIFLYDKIFKLCVPAAFVPWSRFDSFTIYLSLVMKVLNPALVILDPSGVLNLIAIVASFLLSIAFLVASLRFGVHFDSKV